MDQASRKNPRELAGVWLLTVVVFCLSAVLPSAGSTVYGSPDETANAVVAQTIERTGTARFLHLVAEGYAFLHPRSFVSMEGSVIVPVGFLGVPWLLAQLLRVLPVASLTWMGSVIAASAVWPLFGLLRRRVSFFVALWGSALACSAPAFLYYANRGLFAQIPQVGLGLWLAWSLETLAHEPMLARRARFGLAIASGMLASLVFFFRPIEVLWMLPWFVWVAWEVRPSRAEAACAVAGALVIAFPILWMTAHTYGSPWAVGYWMREVVPSSAAALSGPPLVAPWFVRYLPYGFHPRHILQNVRLFGFGLLWPWGWLLTVAGAAGIWRAWRQRERALLVFFALVGWTLAVLLTVYGSGWYLDNIQVGAITMGNSFIRYLLPVGVIGAMGTAWLVDRLPRTSFVRALLLAVVIAMSGFGVWRAFFADTEGIWSMRGELERYAEIRQSTASWLAPGEPVFSERSDKVFFPTFYGVSPLPDPRVVHDLLVATAPTAKAGLFVRPLSQTQKDAWRAAGLQVQELATFGRERLYLLTLP